MYRRAPNLECTHKTSHSYRLVSKWAIVCIWWRGWTTGNLEHKTESNTIIHPTTHKSSKLARVGNNGHAIGVQLWQRGVHMGFTVPKNLAKYCITLLRSLFCLLCEGNPHRMHCEILYTFWPKGIRCYFAYDIA